MNDLPEVYSGVLESEDGKATAVKIDAAPRGPTYAVRFTTFTFYNSVDDLESALHDFFEGFKRGGVSRFDRVESVLAKLPALEGTALDAAAAEQVPS